MGKLIYDVSRVMAWFGGFVLSLVAVVSVSSIAGRSLSAFGLGPVPGDFDVGMFWNSYPAPLQRFLKAATDALMLAVWLLLVWRMGVAMLEYRSNGEVSFILQMPVWWGYAASMLPALLGCVVYFWRLLETLGLAATQDGFTTAEGGH